MNNALEVQCALRKFFESGQVLREEKLKLWDILSALRGPDDQNAEMKAATTAVIRCKLFGAYTIDGIADANIDTEEKAESRKRWVVSSISDHFIFHARSAFAALGMVWAQKNYF